MKLLLATFFLVAGIRVQAQTVANPSNVLHPIMKDLSKRNAPTSLDRDPKLAAEFRTPTPSARPSSLSSTPAATAQPVEIVAQIDVNLVASPLSMIGTISGIKGRLYVTNVGSQVVIPKAQFAVCDRKGFKIAATAKTGQALAPNEAEKIEVLATNLDAADLKLMKLSATAGN